MGDNGTLKVLAILRSHDAEAAFKTVSAEIAGAKVETRVADVRAEREAAGGLNGADVLLLDLGFEDPGELDAVAKIVDGHSSQIPIIASSASVTADGVRQLIRLGVTDFLPQPISRAELVNALEAAARRRREMRPPSAARGTVLAFLNSRGGMGATTLAVQGAFSLVGRGKSQRRVCLLDLDLQLGNAALYLDLSEGPGLLDVLNSTDIDGSFLRGVMACHKSGLELLPAPGPILPLDAVGPEVVGRLLQVARQEYDYVVMDLPHPWTMWKREALAASDRIVLVTQLTVAAIRETRRQLDTLKDEALGDVPLSIVVNRFVRRRGNTVRIKEAEEALGHRIEHFVGNDYKTVRKALDHGLLLFEANRGRRLHKQIRRLVTTLTENSSDGKGAGAVIVSSQGSR